MILENEFGKIEVNELGGELTSVFFNEINQELLSKNNSWNRTAPWLFPIVGELSNGFFRHEGKVFKIPRHGIVRDKVWKLKEGKDFINASYTHKPDDIYPFDFKIEVKYSLLEDQLKIEVNIKAGDKTRYNLGWHPAFKYNGDIKTPAPFTYDSSNNNLVGHKQNKNEKLLFKDIVDDKTYIYDSFNLRLNYADKPILIHWCDFNFLAVWTKNKNEFISIEPWAKNLDLLNATPDLKTKDLLNGDNEFVINIFYKDIDKKCFKNDCLII